MTLNFMFYSWTANTYRASLRVRMPYEGGVVVSNSNEEKTTNRPTHYDLCIKVQAPTMSHYSVRAVREMPAPGVIAY